MKLSKKSLMNALILATEKTASLMFAGAQNALQDGVLEIEGYVREDHLRDTTKMADEWTKFDLHDPKTFPPDDKIVLAYGFPDPDDNRSCAVYFFAWADSAGMFLGQESADPEVHFWQPLPKPPIEQEEKCG